MHKKFRYKVLIGSPIRQQPQILKQFLISLDELEKDKVRVDYFFIDDNENSLSKKLLEDFREKIGSTAELLKRKTGKVILKEGDGTEEKYICSEDTHQWKESLIWKVAGYKNSIIEYAKQHFYDYLFLIDSDIILNPRTLKHLMHTRKDIISEIFWTKWRPNYGELPQVWLHDQYSLFEKGRGEDLTQQEVNARMNSFLVKLRNPGIYQVGGLGACTLISKEALQKGVNFNEIYNVSFWGEDRHFSIRAAALGFKLFVDTKYPAYHIYRKSDLDNVAKYKKGLAAFDENKSSEPSTVSTIDSHLTNMVSRFIKSYLSCDYRIVTGFEAFKHLAPHYINKLTQKQEVIIDYLVDNKINCTAEPIEISVDTGKITEGIAKADIKLLIHDKGNLEEREKKYGCNLTLKKYNQGMWLVDAMSFTDDNMNSMEGDCLAAILQGEVKANI